MSVHDLATVTLSHVHWCQLIDGLTLRAEVWDRTAEYLDTGLVQDEGIEECNDSDEARQIARHYREIIRQVERTRTPVAQAPAPEPAPMTLHLLHGRRAIGEEMNEWGFTAPVLDGVVCIHTTYDVHTNVYFATRADAERALAVFGWEWWNDSDGDWSLEIPHSDGMLYAPLYEGAPAWFGDWELQRAGLHERDRLMGPEHVFPDRVADRTVPSVQTVPAKTVRLLVAALRQLVAECETAEQRERWFTLGLARARAALGQVPG